MENKCPALQYQGGGEGGTHTSSCQKESQGDLASQTTLFPKVPPKSVPFQRCFKSGRNSLQWRDFQGKWCHQEEFCREVEALGEHAEETASFLQRPYVKSWQAQKGVREKLDIAPRGGGVRPQFYSWAKFQECMGFYCTLRTKLCCFQGGWICQHFLVHLWRLTSMALRKTKGRY